MTGSIRRSARPIGAFVIALVLLSQGMSAPFVKDAEPQSAQWIADIVRHDHWLLPVDYYGAINRKPPLFYWLAAIATEVSGGHLDEVRARVVSVVAGAAVAVLVLEWTAATIDATTGSLAIFFLMGSYAFASRATTALTDMLFSMLLLAAYCAIYPAIEGSVSRPRIVAIGVLLGLAVLTKGPVAIVLIVLATGFYLMLTSRNPLRLVTQGWPWLVILVAVGIAAAWYVPAFLEGRREGIGEVFLEENFGHFLPADLGGTGEAARPVYFIVMRLIGGAMPLALLIPVVGWALLSGDFVEKFRGPILFQLAMALAVVIFFSAASSKRDDYILPALPPLAILFAAVFTSLHADGSASRSGDAVLRDLTVAVIATFVLLSIVALFFIRNSNWFAGVRHLLKLQSSDSSYLGIFIDGMARRRPSYVIFTCAELAGAIAIIVGVMQRQPRLAGGGFAVVSLAGTLLWTGVVRPEEMRTRSEVRFAAEVSRMVGASAIYVPFRDPEFSWYFGRAVPPLPPAIARSGPTATPVYFVARPTDLKRLTPAVRAELQPVQPSYLQSNPPTLYLLRPPARYSYLVDASSAEMHRPKHLANRIAHHNRLDYP